MTRRPVLVIGACLALSAATQGTQIYKCTSPDGRVSFEDRPCTEGAQQVLPTRRIPVEGEAPVTAGPEARGAATESGVAASVATDTPPVTMDPSQPMVSGTIYGERFSFTRGRVFKISAYALEIRQGAGLKPDKGITIFLWGSENMPVAGRVFESPDPSLTQQPQIILIWTSASGERRQEEITTGYTMRLAFGQPSDGEIDGHIALALPDKSALEITGRFVVEIDY